MAEWAKLKVVNLKAELKKRGLSQAGLKTELIARLEESDAAAEVESSHHGSDSPVQDDDSHTIDGDNGNNAHREESGQNGTASADDAEVATREEEAVREPSVAGDDVPQPENASTLPASEREQGERQDPEQQQQQQQQQEPGQEPEHSSENDRDQQQDREQEQEQEQQQEKEQEQDQEQEKEKEKDRDQDQDQESLAAKVKPTVDEAPAQDSAQATTKTTTTFPDTNNDHDVIMENEKPQPQPDLNSASPRLHELAAEPVPMSIDPPSPEGQKRKRRSASPLSEEQDIASRKRARASSPSATEQNVCSLPDVDYDRHVEPSIHPATSALYINNLMRPLRPDHLRAHIVALAAAPGSPPDDDDVTKFHLDFIRTHALVELSSVSAASRVRQLLHGRVWPNESNRKALHIDFVPPDKMDEWIAIEDSEGRRPAARWEVIYSPSADGHTVQADLVSTSLSSSSSSNRPPAPPTRPSSSARAVPSSGVNSAPLGPRGFSDTATTILPPTGPRGGGGRRPAAAAAAAAATASCFSPEQERHTHAKPVISYCFVPRDLVERRISSMRSFYAPDKRPLGREINRYSFEDGASFVDRGREIFEGIRPPHRERGGRGGRGGGGGRGDGRGRRGGGGGGGFRPRSDRYIPGGTREDPSRRRY